MSSLSNQFSEFKAKGKLASVVARTRSLVLTAARLAPWMIVAVALS